MARLFETGAETRSGSAEAVNKSASCTIDTSIFRSGSASFRCNTGSLDIASRVTKPIAGVLGRWYRTRAYFRFSDLPAVTNSALMYYFSDVELVSARITPTGKLILWNNVSGTQIGSNSSATIKTDGTWYRVELAINLDIGAIDQAELYLDGSLVATATSLSLSDVAVANISIGWASDSVTGINKICNVDDIAINDDQGASQNSYPGSGKLVLLVPISDNARDTLWTGGAGGTTNLWKAVSNLPPTGTATETDLTQIEHAGGAAGTTDRYDANMTTYASAGITSADTINVITFIEIDGEDVATGAKLLNFEVLSNPVIASPGNVTAGDDVGALGTYPTNWSTRTHQGVTYNPVISINTSPVMRVRRPETANRVASVCFMGMYVDYTPPTTSPPSSKSDFIPAKSSQIVSVNRASFY